MLTTMMEEDWTIVLKVFEASHLRRGDKGRDDRPFLEAFPFVLRLRKSQQVLREGYLPLL
jgi:hypothetical protein